jgi:hypothetical protein
MVWISQSPGRGPAKRQRRKMERLFSYTQGFVPGMENLIPATTFLLTRKNALQFEADRSKY